MALIRSAMLSSISGSIGGMTFARNRGGAYFRNRTVPINPNSDNQIVARAAMTNSSQLWRGQVNAVQEAWKLYADNTPVTNRLGETTTLSGFNQFVQLNAFLQYLGLAAHTAAPIAYGTANAWTNLEFNVDSAGDTVAITGGAGPDLTATANYGFWISNPISTGLTFYKGPWHYLGTLTGADVAAGLDTFPIPFNAGLGQDFRLRVRGHDTSWRMGPEYITPIATAA